jgi:putative Mg2+ transporter-C (MgtC) family protein
MEWFHFSFNHLLINAFKLVLAFLLALPIAWERERSTHIMGLRTFPLVAVASCGYVLSAAGFLDTDENAKARIIQGLMTGIGFIGGGAIVKEGATVRGTATAASVWSTGALGVSVAYEQYEVALLISLANYLTLIVLTPIEKRIKKAHRNESHRSSHDQDEK